MPMQRRRGPGKANKGSKTKKAQQITSEGRKEQEAGREGFILDSGDSGGPRQPYTSVMSLEKFTFQPPTASTPPGGQSGMSVGPETEQGQPRSPKAVSRQMIE